MKSVDGVYTAEDYKRLFDHLQAHYPEMALFWQIGCETGYRVSDLLTLHIKDIKERQICIVERKTKRERTATISEATERLLIRHRNNKMLLPYSLIWSYNRQQVWRCIRRAGLAVGLPRLGLGHIAHARHMLGSNSYALLL